MVVALKPLHDFATIRRVVVSTYQSVSGAGKEGQDELWTQTKEEWKMVVETKKILDPKIKVTATCVRVPVFVGHSEAVNVEFERPITADEARDVLRDATGVSVIDKREPGGYATPVESVGEYDTYVSRIREDATIENGLNIWVVSDNLRKGAALNTVQILETLIERNLVERKAA
jgi:aspartate-semialdehyde dehydrogenase